MCCTINKSNFTTPGNIWRNPCKYVKRFEAILSQNILLNGDFSFSIQAGSYSKPENAQKLVDELTAKGYEAYITQYMADGLNFYRVRVGRFNTKDELLPTESRLKAEGLPTKIFP